VLFGNGSPLNNRECSYHWHIHYCKLESHSQNSRRVWRGRSLDQRDSDLSAIIKDVEHSLRHNKRLNAKGTGVASLHAVLSKANTTINHLHAFVSRVLIKEEGLLRNARISRTAWLREKPQVSMYQRQLLAIKLELSHALGIANL
jgi:hypothetical protein